MTCNISLLAPLIGLTIDTQLFCQPIFRSRLLLVLCAGYTAYSYMGVLTSPTKAFPAMGLSSNIPQSFGYQWFATTVCGVFVYAMVVNGTRRILHRLGQLKTHPL